MKEAATQPDGDNLIGGVDRTRVTIAGGLLVGPVLSRIVGIHASRAHLPLDRLNDAVLIADAIAARAPAYAVGHRLPVSVQSFPGRLEIRVGPLRPGGGARVLDAAALPEVGSVIERLADTVRMRPGAGGDEYLVMRVGEGEGARPRTPPATR